MTCTRDADMADSSFDPGSSNTKAMEIIQMQHLRILILMEHLLMPLPAVLREHQHPMTPVTRRA